MGLAPRGLSMSCFAASAALVRSLARSMMLAQTLALMLTLMLGLSACGGALPSSPSSAALHRDLERLVGLADAEGWSIDRVEVQEVEPAALMSLCRTTEESRSQLLSWLDSRIEALGGPPALAYERHGRDLGAIDELLTLSRIRMVLVQGMRNAEQDCPFWVGQSRDFRGRQILDDRWFVSLGGGGKGLLVRQEGVVDVNFGGAGRLLAGRGIGRHATLLAGLELGVGAAFPKDAEGDRGALTLAIDSVVPLVYRHRLVNSYWEAEAGYIAHTTDQDYQTTHGVHVGAAIGGSAARRRWIFPGAALGISYERIVEDKILHIVKLGFRVAFDVSL